MLKLRLKAGRTFGLLLVLLVVMIPITYWLATGPENLAQYPRAEESPYRLPWTAGQTHLCVQGNRGVVSHRGWGRFAYDFRMPIGTEICAARAGKVVRVVVDHDGHGHKWPNNLVAIQHDDGTLAFYLHLKKGGNLVKTGDIVRQGQAIALSGDVGNSMMPHLHFHVTDAQRKSTLPVTFSDLGKDLGLPRMFKSYRSGDSPAR